MIRAFFMIALALTAGPVVAETVVAARTIRPQSVLSSEDLAIVDGDIAGAISTIGEAVGLETRVVLYSGRPVRMGDIGPPATVERNQIVRLVYATGGLTISAEARALGRAGPGDTVRAMNLTSKSTVSGIVAKDETIHVITP